jgi:hypothetical protein
VQSQTWATTPSAEQLTFFEKKIRPVLIQQCYECHSTQSKKVKGGLLLDTAQSMIQGGDSGIPGVTPGKPAQSSIYTAMTWEEDDMQMPPKHKLEDSIIADFKTWITAGAADPRQTDTVLIETQRPQKRTIDIDEGRKHWAFIPPHLTPAPIVKETSWPRSTVDSFILAGLEQQGLKPAADADKSTLIRRICYDLTGLPPTPDQVTAFIHNDSPDAVKNLIGDLLATERYGERWARMWLDVARYAESSGKDVNLLYPHAWRYRDYVIDAFNQDKPYDQFVREQIAGDLLKYKDPRQQAEQIIATGFLALGSKSHNERNPRQFEADLIDEQIDTLSQAMLGLTIACARCHDHKFDPVTQKDYYALAGIFLSSETLYGTSQQLQNLNPSTLIELKPESGLANALGQITTAEYVQLKERAEAAESNLIESRSTLAQNRDSKDPVNRFLRLQAVRQRASTAAEDLGLFQEDGTPRLLCMGVLERNRPEDANILIRGELTQLGERVPRGLVEVLCGKDEPRNISQGSGRLDLAYWMTSPQHPLTARVIVNRVWAKLFGKGLVVSMDNFGLTGSKPTHPALLDYLAVEFMQDGWSIKRLIQRLMLSRSYQMSSQHSADYAVKDPENNWLWHFTPRRLDAEALRDGTLAVAGSLNVYPSAGSPVALAPSGREGMIQLVQSLDRPQYTRSIYLPIVRDFLPEWLSLFDFPDASLVAGERDSTNVPSQSLFLMNHPQVLSAADAFAIKVAEYQGSPQEKMNYAFMTAYGRGPKATEVAAATNFFRMFSSKSGIKDTTANKQATLSAFCQALLASAEFRYLN